jgi:hypothetical protein
MRRSPWARGSQRHALSGQLRLGSGPLIDPHRLALCDPPRAPALGTADRDLRTWILGVDPLVFVHVGDDDLAIMIERAQEGGLLAITAIGAHPGKAHPVGPRVADDLKG